MFLKFYLKNKGPSHVRFSGRGFQRADHVRWRNVDSRWSGLCVFFSLLFCFYIFFLLLLLPCMYTCIYSVSSAISIDLLSRRVTLNLPRFKKLVRYVSMISLSLRAESPSSVRFSMGIKQNNKISTLITIKSIMFKFIDNLTRSSLAPADDNDDESLELNNS